MPPKKHPFPRSARLTRPAEFRLVFSRRVRTSAGPLLLHSMPRHLDASKSPAPAVLPSRLGLSVAASVGTAPARNRIKRLLRESFRLLRAQLPVGYDFLITVRPHAPLSLSEYQLLLASACDRAHQSWLNRR